MRANRISDTQSRVEIELNAWREKTINNILAVATIVMLPVFILYTIEKYTLLQGWKIPLLYLTLYSTLACLAIIRKIDSRIRAWGFILLGQFVGTLALIFGGLAGDGRIYLFTMPILALIIIGHRESLIATILSAITYFVVAAGLHQGWLTQWLIFPENPTQPIVWLNEGLVVAACMIFIIVLLSHLNKSLEKNITDRFRAVQELRESQERFRNLSEATFEAIFISEKGICIEQNSTAEQMFGYAHEEAVERMGIEWISPEDREIVQNHMLSGYEKPYEVTALRKDGTTFPCEIQGKVIEYQGRQVRVTALRDITSRKNEETINRIQRDLAVALNATTDLEEILSICSQTAIENTVMDAGGIYLVDRVTGSLNLASTQGLSEEFVASASYFDFNAPNVVLVNKGEPLYLLVEELPPEAPENKEGLKIVVALPIQHEERIIACLNVASHTEKEIPEISRNILEAIALQVGGAIARARSVETVKQRVIQLALINEIGDKMAALLNLDRLLEQAATMVQNHFGYQHVSLFIINPETEIVEMKALAGEHNNQFPVDHQFEIGSGIVGWAAQHNETALVNDTDNDSRYVEHNPNILRTKSELSVPIQIGGKVLGVIDIQSQQPNTFDESDVVVMETLADQMAVAIHNANLLEIIQKELNHRKEAEASLQEYSERLEEMVIARTQELNDAQEKLVRKEKLAVLGQLAGGVGHDLRNPLSVISNAVYYLKMIQGDADQKIKEYLEIIKKEVFTAERIVTDLLNFARTKDPAKERISIDAILAGALERNAAPDNVDVTLQIPPGFPNLYVDPRQMEQVVGNLINNAFQAMPDGGELTIKSEVIEDNAWISITDTGFGISSQNMKRLFEPLFTTKANGLGLGLATSKNVVEAHNGILQVESQIGKGSTFVISLPFKKSGEIG